MPVASKDPPVLAGSSRCSPLAEARARPIALALVIGVSRAGCDVIEPDTSLVHESLLHFVEGVVPARGERDAGALAG